MIWIDANTVFGAYALRSVDLSVGRLLALMRKHGFAQAVTCSTTGIFYDAASGNEETLRVCAEHPELIPAATINPSKYYEDGEVARLAGRGFRLLRLFNAVQGWPVRGYTPFEVVCVEADQAGLPIMLDANSLGDISAVGEVARRMKVPVIVAGCNYAHQAEAIAVARRTPNLYVELHRLTSPDGIELLSREIGADRLVYGSQAPLNYMGHTRIILEEAVVDEADRAAIAGGNLARILDLPPAPEVAPETGAEAFPPPSLRMKKIDIHGHLGHWYSPEKDHLAALVAALRKWNIERSILSSTRSLLVDMETGNREVESAVEAHEELLGYVYVDPTRPEAATAEIERYANHPGFVGIKSRPDYHGVRVESPAFREILAAAAEYRLPALIHYWGVAPPTAHIAMAEEFDLPIILAHAGGDLWKQCIDAVRECSNIYLDFCSSIADAGKIEYGIATVGAERVLYGTDVMLIHPAWTMGMYLDAEISEEARRLIFRENALRLFRLDL